MKLVKKIMLLVLSTLFLTTTVCAMVFNAFAEETVHEVTLLSVDGTVYGGGTAEAPDHGGVIEKVPNSYLETDVKAAKGPTDWNETGIQGFSLDISDWNKSGMWISYYLYISDASTIVGNSWRTTFNASENFWFADSKIIDSIQTGWNLIKMPTKVSANEIKQVSVTINTGFPKPTIYATDIKLCDDGSVTEWSSTKIDTIITDQRVPVDDFVLMDINAELIDDATFGWTDLDSNGLAPVDVSPNVSGRSVRLITSFPALLINFPVSVLPKFNIGAAAQFWFYVPDASVLKGSVRVEAKTSVYNTVSIPNAVSGWNKVSVPIQSFQDGEDAISQFNIYFETNENYIPASILISEIKFVDTEKKGILETKALPESAAFETANIELTAGSSIVDIPAITIFPDNFKIDWTYTSSNTDVVKIIKGQLVAYSDGVSTITAKSGELEAVLTVTAKDIPVISSLIVTGGTEYTINATERLKLDVKPDKEGGYYILSYKSSDNNVAVVSSKGTITGASAGTCVITVTLEGTEISTEITVTVNENKKQEAPSSGEGCNSSISTSMCSVFLVVVSLSFISVKRKICR